MSKLFKFLPVLAIVAGLVGAFGFSNVQSPCEDPDHIGYSTNGNGSAPTGTGDPRFLGIYGQDFDCSASGSNCHWVYVPAAAGVPAHWLQCTNGGYNVL